MSLSLRDQRGRIYRYSDVGTGGLMISRYTFSVERWCRFETASAREQTLAAKANDRIDGVIAFADEAVVGVHDLITVNDVQYKVTGVRPVRQQREILCTVVLGDEDANSLVES